MVDEYQRWKASQARQWAAAVRRSCMRMEQQRIALEEAIGAYDGLAAVSYGDWRGRPMEHGDDRMAEAVAQLDSIRGSFCDAVADYAAYVGEFQRALRMLDGLYDALLTARYIRGICWADVSEQLGYTHGYVRDDLAIAALASLYDVMPMRYKSAIPEAI